MNEERVYRGDWFIEGDLANFDADGCLHYHRRNDDIMNAMGYRVSPLEVEQMSKLASNGGRSRCN